jgi:hypothetical protein
MKKEHSKLMEKVLQSFDWDSILEINKVLKVGTGMGSEIIPGVKKKPFSEKITKGDFKSELRALIKHAVEKHIPQLNYGNWIIYWVSDDWDVEINYPQEMDDEDIEGMEEEETYFVMEPHLEVIYSPQRISLAGEISEDIGEEKEYVNLEEMLDKAIKNEDYELATKIRDLISQNREKKIDK